MDLEWIKKISHFLIVINVTRKECGARQAVAAEIFKTVRVLGAGVEGPALP